MAVQFKTFSRLLSETLAQNKEYNAEVLRAIKTGQTGVAREVPTSDDEDATDTDAAPPKRQNQASRSKKSRGSKKTASGKAKGRKKKGKKSSLWYGIVSGQTGSFHNSESDALARLRELPHGRSSLCDPMASLQPPVACCTNTPFGTLLRKPLDSSSALFCSSGPSLRGPHLSQLWFLVFSFASDPASPKLQQRVAPSPTPLFPPMPATPFVSP
jgi:hypothetical protein